MKTRLFSTLFSLLILTFPVSSFATDFLELAKNKVLTCFHPTAKPAKASAKYTVEPQTEGARTTAFVKVYYEGWLKKHSMRVKMTTLQIDKITLLQVKMVEDTNTKTSGCTNMTTDRQWYELAQ